jgi:two-component system, OmpR family, alkaline phosphatase synthesis response regulator PhoP
MPGDRKLTMGRISFGAPPDPQSGFQTQPDSSWNGSGAADAGPRPDWLDAENGVSPDYFQAPEAAQSSVSPEVSEDTEGPGDAYCSTTNRIVIVSPLPQRIHELIRGLSAACYDVMVFHHGDPSLLSRLQADLLIADLTRPDGAGNNSWLHSPELSGMQIIRLISPGTPDAKDSGRLVEWPAPLPDAITYIRSAAAAGYRPAVAGPEPASPSMEQGPVNTLRLKDLTLDLKRHAAAVGTARLDLTKTEFDLLRVLLETGGSVLTRQELMDRVWGDEYFGGSNTVDVHVKTLRQKLGDDPRHSRYIVTVRGIGYRAADG